MAYLLEHLPPQVHLIISTRVDPALPLARLRARGDLVEIRAADLRFTLTEVAAYLNDVAALELTPADIAALETRTEGWIAALQLAALSLRGRADTRSFIAALRRRRPLHRGLPGRGGAQPPAVAGPRLPAPDLHPGPVERTAVRGRHRQHRRARRCSSTWTAPTCSSSRWTTPAAGTATTTCSPRCCRPTSSTERPERGRRPAPPRQPVVRRGRANLSPRCGTRSPPATSTGQPTSPSSPCPALQRDRQEATIARAGSTVIPDEVVQGRPVLALGFIGALMSSGQFDGVEERLDDLEQHLQAPRPDGEAGGPPRGRSSSTGTSGTGCPLRIELYRSALSLIHGDPVAAIDHADLATSIAADDDHLTRAGAAATAGLARWAGGDLEAGAPRLLDLRRRAATGRTHLRRAGLLDHPGRHPHHPRPAHRRLCGPTRTRCASPKTTRVPVTRGTADMHVGISGVAYERNDLATAAHHLQLSRELGDAAGLPQNPYRWRAAEARLLAAQGDLPAAIELLDEAEQVYFGDFAPNVRPIAARRTRLQLARGDLASATSWAAAHEPGRRRRALLHARVRAHHLGDGAPGPTPGRALIQLPLHVARRLLERLLAAAEAGGRMGNVIEILVQLALASEAEGDRSACHGPARSCPGPWRAPRATSGSSSTQDQPWRGAAQRRAGLGRGAPRARSARRRCAGTAAARPACRAAHLRDRRSRSSTRSASGSSTFCGCSTATWVGPP